MKLVIFTLVLDGYRFLPHHFFTLSRLKTVDWQWIIVEGAAANTGSTAWCKVQCPRYSVDGTTEFLKEALWSHPRIRVMGKKWWAGGKDEMCAAALETIKEPCILMQMDADELWESDHLERISQLVEWKRCNCARFDCVYMVGPNLRVVGRNCWGQQHGEFLRAWRFEPGMTMRHEPPFLNGVNGPNERPMHNETTRDYGLVFEHWAYAFLDQIEYKQEFYGYTTAVEGWKRLQAYTGPFPTALQPFFPWVNGNPMVDRVFKP